MKLIRYWFEFENSENLPPGIILGCGVTAFDFTDAIHLLNQNVFIDENIPNILNRIENVDINQLYHLHVIPNMKPPVYRGVWYPICYDSHQVSSISL